MLGNTTDAGRIIISGSRIDDALIVLNADSTNDIRITGNTFSHGTSALVLNYTKKFNITGNTFYNYTDGIVTSNSRLDTSAITGNYFAELPACITFNNDNHLLLEINCNQFVNYGSYGIKSNTTNLKNQGSSVEGAGNWFFSFPGLVNHQLWHNGNQMIYYTDPSNPFTLVYSPAAGMNALSVEALNDGCQPGTRFAASEEGDVPDDAPGLLKNVPNPANEHTVIYFSTGNDKINGRIIISSVTGQEMGSYAVRGTDVSVEIDCSSFANGLYFYSLVLGEQVIATQKLVITR